MAKILVVFATLLFLSSIGGAMAVGMPFLVPLHWWFARKAYGVEYGIWVVLALLSMWLASYLYIMLIDGPGSLAFTIVVAALGVSVAFIATTDDPSLKVGPESDPTDPESVSA